MLPIQRHVANGPGYDNSQDETALVHPAIVVRKVPVTSQVKTCVLSLASRVKSAIV